MSDGVWRCGKCGYSQGRSWGQVNWKCPRCNGKRDYVANLVKENARMKKRIKELEDQINPPYLGDGI